MDELVKKFRLNIKYIHLGCIIKNNNPYMIIQLEKDLEDFQYEYLVI